MSAANKRLLIYFEDEGPFVERLGAAVISCWRELPLTVRAAILDRSSEVLVDDDVMRLDQRLSEILGEPSPDDRALVARAVRLN